MDYEVFDKKSASSYLKMSVSNIDRLIQKREIPYSKVGKKVLFLREDLLNWLKMKRVVIPPDIEVERRKADRVNGWLTRE